MGVGNYMVVRVGKGLNAVTSSLYDATIAINIRKQSENQTFLRATRIHAQ